MSVNTASGWKVSIGPTTPAADATAYAALTYAPFGEIQSIGEFGDEAADVTFTSLSDGRVRHLKGARDAGVLALVCGHDALDAGQIAAKAAEKTNFSYAIKIEAADALDANDTDSVFYFHAQVQSARINPGENDSVVTVTFNLGITTAIIEVPATVVP